MKKTKLSLGLLLLCLLFSLGFWQWTQSKIYNPTTVSGALDVTSITNSGTLTNTGLATLLGGFISNASSSVGASLHVSGVLNSSSTLNSNNLVWVNATGTNTALLSPISFTTGAAIRAADYQCGRDADATNQLHCNVPTGASMEWSVNDVAQLTLDVNTLNTLGNDLSLNSLSFINSLADSIIQFRDSQNISTAGLAISLGTNVGLNTLGVTNNTLNLNSQTFTTASGHTAVAAAATWETANANRFGMTVNPTQNGANTLAMTGLSIAATKATGATTLAVMNGLAIQAPSVAGTVTQSNALIINDQTNSGITTARGIRFTATGIANSILWGASALQYANSTENIRFIDSTNNQGIDFDFATTRSPRIIASSTAARLGLGMAVPGYTLSVSGTMAIEATSTTQIPLSIYDSGRGLTFEVASSSITQLSNATTEGTGGGISLVTVGDSTARGGAMQVRATSAGNGGAIVLYRNTTAIGAQLTGGLGLIMGTGNATTSLSAGVFTFDQQTGSNAGRFSITTGGNVSATGTARVYGGATTGGINFTSSNTTTTLVSFVSGGGAQNQGVGAFVLTTNATLGKASSTILFSLRNGTAAGASPAITGASGAVFSISSDGGVRATGTFVSNAARNTIGDFAEYVDTEGTVSAGDLVEPTEDGKFRIASPHSKTAAGVITDTGAFLIGAEGENRAPLAMAGIVKVNATTINGSIKVGDKLEASKSGFVSRSVWRWFLPSRNMGMALEPLLTGEGRIKMLIQR